MKLLAKYNRVNIPITIAILLFSSLGYYFILHYVLVHQLDKDLEIEKQEILHQVKESNTLPETSDYKDQQIKFTVSKVGNFKSNFQTEDVYNIIEKEGESYRRLDFPLTVNGNNFVATVRKSQQETEDIVQLILLITFSVIAFLLVILFIANRVLLGKLWKPFNNTLDQLTQFNLSGKNRIELEPTDIDEFAELNKTVIIMTKKVSNDYESLKTFTENASHEIQTPLAIIKSKIELLSQSENLDEVQMNILQSLNEATTRLSRLNQSLLLLTKIENAQFVQTEHVNISSLILKYIEFFEELAATKNITITRNIEAEQFAEMNETLAETLVSNIIINAIKHNISGGHIEISLEGKLLTVSNTGSEPKRPTLEFFERFKKDAASGDSLGLGLSIVKKICENYGFSVFYKYIDEKHVVMVRFIPGLIN